MVEKFDITLNGGLKSAKPKRSGARKRFTSQTAYYWGLVGQIGFIVAVPVTIGALLGAYIDRTLQMRPYGIYSGIGIGTILSVVGFIRVIKDALKKGNY